jgi:hypothetical protein
VKNIRNAGIPARHQQELDARVEEAVTVLAASQQALSADRIAHHREMLMNQIIKSEPLNTDDPKASEPITPMPRRWRRLVLAGSGVVAIGALVAGPAAAAQVTSFIHRAPQSVEEADRMEVIYQGSSYSWAQIYDLQAHGKAKVTVEGPATYNKGQAHAFDSETEAQAWACANISGLAKRPVCQSSSPAPDPAHS